MHRLNLRKATNQLVILIDTREQTPFSFGDIQTRRAKLDTGDYAIEGYEKECVIERKSKSDAYGCVGSGRDRFTKCLERLSQLKRGAIVIESGLRHFAIPPKRTAIDARQAVGSYISWSCLYRIPVYWCDSKEYAARVTLRYLMAFVKHVHGKDIN